MTPHDVHRRIVAAGDVQVAASPDAKAIVDAGLGEQLGRLIQAISANVSNPLAADCDDTVAAALKRARPFAGFDELRTILSKALALATASERHFDDTSWGPDVARQRIEIAAHLIGATRESSEQALLALDALNSDLATGEGGTW